MFAVERPNDLLRNFYTLVQAHTTRTPGPSFIKLLKKAGIEEIDPPTKDELNTYMSTLKKPSIANIGKEIASEEIISNIMNVGTTAIAAFAGGGLLNNIRNAVTSSRQLQVSISIAVTGIVIDLARYATRENDETTLMFLSDSSWIAMVGTWIGYDLHTHIEERREERARAERAAELRRALGEEFAAQNAPLRRQIRIANQAVQLIREQQEIRNAALATQSGILDITTLPSSGELPMKLGEDVVDPITQQPFQEGDMVAVVKGNKQQPVLVNELQSWIAARHPRTPTHPTTNATIETLADVKIYSLRRKATGGKRKTKKQLKKFSKKQQNVRSLRKRARR